MAFKSFAEAYNARRHEHEARTTLLEPPKKLPRPAIKRGISRKLSKHGSKSAMWEDSEAGNFVVRRISSWKHNHGGGNQANQNSPRGYRYTLVRSDLDEEHRMQGLPAMQASDLGMRRRAEGLIAQLMHQREEEARRGPFAFVEGDFFLGVSGLVICINALLIGLETDIQTPAWMYLEEMLLCFFVFELMCRMLHNGWDYFKHEDDWAWNCFDFAIVASGVFDQWVVPCLERAHLLDISGEGEGAEGGAVVADDFGGDPASAPLGDTGTAVKPGQRGGGMTVFFMLMRMLRLLRIVRLFRLVKIVRPLYELAQGVLEALSGMFWVLVFVVMTLYATAILCTRFLGDGELLDEAVGDAEDIMRLKEILSMFVTVEDSMFALFGTMSSWSLLKFAPIFEEMPLLKPTFVVFYVYSAWALLAVMTGVVSENMIAIREQMLKEDEARDELRKSMVTKILIELFQESDTDHSGKLSRQEFDEMLDNEALVRKIERNTRLKKQDMQDLFDWIDHDGSGSVTIDEFMAGFKWVLEPLRAKLLVKLQDRLTSQLGSLQRAVKDCMEQRIAEVQKLVAGPLQKVHAITEQMQTLDGHFSGLRQGIREQTEAMPTPQELRDVERRLSEKLAMVALRLEKMERKAALEARRSSQ